MTDSNLITHELQELKFTEYSKVIRKLLSTYEISEPTIAKIVAKVGQGEVGPFYVYRRASIYCLKNNEEFKNNFRVSLPLVIVIRPNKIELHNKDKGVIECSYSELYKYTEFLSPLYSFDINKNDQYSTIELDTLVQQLYRELKLNNNEEGHIRNFLFSLLYIAHFRCILEIEQISRYLIGYNKDNEKKLSSVFQYFFNEKCPFIVDTTPCLIITKEAYKYIFAIINFDTNLIDAEMLTSLIYRMVDSNEVGLYGHQTSFMNVERLLQPLFLNQLRERVYKSTNENVYQTVQCIHETIIFDPTNGPGCFLVSGYNGLVQLLREIEYKFDIKCCKPLNISNFIALVENDLTQSLTRLALTYTHTKELKRLGIINMQTINTLYENLRLYIGDELTSDWSKYVNPQESLYIVGSPKFLGGNKIPENQKKVMRTEFSSSVLYNADYCSTWVVKAAKFISGSRAKAAYVLTNSVSQGEQSTFILNKIESLGCEYIFACRSFKWRVSKDNTAITVVVIGLASQGLNDEKCVYYDNHLTKCNKIGNTLLPDIDIRVTKRTRPISELLPHMRKGNMPDGAIPLTFSSDEVDKFLKTYPEAEKFIKPLYGGDEFVNCSPRWVLWISNENLNEAMSIKGISERINKVREIRNTPTSTSSDKSKKNPHKFRETNCTNKGEISIIVPCVTSEHRAYFQMGVLGSNAILNNNVNVIFNCDVWLLALLESRIHLVWALNACGGHETRPRYSSQLCYNTFPVPQLSSEQISVLRNLSKTLLEVREKYCDKSLAELYNKMPPELKKVHNLIDETVDSFYRYQQPFESDEERLVWLMEKYNKLK